MEITSIDMVIQAGTRLVPVIQEQDEKLAPPPMYQVVLLNDDYTPMDFVVMVLQGIFGKNPDEATRIMLKVHYEGRGVCGIYTRDIAATRVDKVLRLAVAHEHPLQCIMEPVED